MPWIVDRSALPWCVLLNAGSERLENISTQIFGVPDPRPAMPQRRYLEPGREMRIILAGLDVQNSGHVTVHWERPDGQEYAWTFVC